MVSACVGVVLAQGGGEIMGAREVLLSAHVEVVVVRVVQHGINADRGGDTDRTWRKALFFYQMEG